MPIGNISDLFTTQIETLTDGLNDAADEPTELEQRIWMLPDNNGWDGSPFSLAGPTGIGSAYDRSDMNDQYAQATTSPSGVVADRMVTKIQADYMAVMERSFRARHASIVRCHMHAAARRQGQGETSGVFYTVKSYIESLIAQAAGAPQGST